MNSERAIQETIARCVSIIVAYYNSGPNERATREMIDEIRAVAEDATSFSLGIRETVEQILHPVEAEIFARYGHELGSRLNSQFLMAFESWGAPKRPAREAPVDVPHTGRARPYGRPERPHRIVREPQRRETC
jgi:hypothetical protein